MLGARYNLSAELTSVQAYDLAGLKSPPTNGEPEEFARSEADFEEWALFVGFKTNRRNPQLTLPGIFKVIAICALVTVVWVAVLIRLNAQTASTTTAATSVQVKLAEADTNPVPTSPAAQTGHVNAKTAVLSADDLPAYSIVSSTQAVRPGGVVANSWDNVFQKSRVGAPDFRMAEAIVVVYGTSDEAITAMDLQSQAEGSQGAKASPVLAGSLSTTWVEPLAIPGYEIVRVVFRTDNVVTQIAILGKDSPRLFDDANALVSIQESRLVPALHSNV